MSYFSDNYSALCLPIAIEKQNGFRESQLAAIHSICAHFFSSIEPAIVTMPTGSGKTLILMTLPYLLRAKRVLVITPSRLVREQIVENFKNLTVLRKIGAAKKDLKNPKVFSTEKRIKTLAEWNKMRNYDVIVATVQSASPAYKAIPNPPKDLFDLILIDEAHHSAAVTWQALLDEFPEAKRVLFTATPFRQDKKEIRGKFVFTYDLKRAYQDKVFGDVQFQPVVETDKLTGDSAIAKAAEVALRKDQSDGLQHLLMVRADTRPRAKELCRIYKEETELKLKYVDGSFKLSTIKKVINELETFQIDGIICVNMFGEGFDFPNLKIAAVHSPHKSLAITLQFIGRFARTNADKTGIAKFLAIPSDIEIETEALYQSSAVWQDIIQNLSAIRVSHEIHIKEVLDSFTDVIIEAENLHNLSLYTLKPYHHVKVYEVNQDIDLKKKIEQINGKEVIFQRYSEEHNATIYITREVNRVLWSTDSIFSNIAYDLFIAHYNRAHSLLFICATSKTPILYQEFVFELCGLVNYFPLSIYRLDRALNGLKSLEFFHVGMHNRRLSNKNETYRTISGERSDRAIQIGDARLYDRGHYFGRATDQGKRTTIGVSRSSKVWSQTSSKIPELILWCDILAERIGSNENLVTGTNLDYLPSGEEVSEIPPEVFSVEWDLIVYDQPFIAKYIDAKYNAISHPLNNFDLLVKHQETNQERIVFKVESDEIECNFNFSLKGYPYISLASPHEPEIILELEGKDVTLLDFLNEYLPSFHTLDFALLQEHIP